MTAPTEGEFTTELGCMMKVAALSEPVSVGTPVEFDTVLVLKMTAPGDRRNVQVLLTAENRASLRAALEDKE